MKMKETLKFLKFGLIGVASVTTISTLTISCGKKANTNNEDTQKPGDTNNQEQIKQTLQAAIDAFNLKAKEGNPHSNINSKTIIDEVTLKTYFDFVGTSKDVTYQFLNAKSSGENNLEVKYKLIYKGEEKEKTILLTGFKGVNQIDYNLEDDFFKIALDKKHLDTIAFFAQEYNFYDLSMFKTWTLTEDPKRYEATKTDQYFILENSKYYIYKINFKNTTGLEPIIVELSDSAPQFAPGSFNIVFTKQGEKRNPFLFAVKEK